MDALLILKVDGAVSGPVMRPFLVCTEDEFLARPSECQRAMLVDDEEQAAPDVTCWLSGVPTARRSAESRATADMKEKVYMDYFRKVRILFSVHALHDGTHEYLHC